MSAQADLRILMTMVDRTKRGFSTFDNNVKKSTKNVSLLSRAFSQTGLKQKLSIGAAVAGLILLTRKGQAATREIIDLGKQLQLTTAQADHFVSAIQIADPAADIDRITEATLTLQERFGEFAARSTGPLKELSEAYSGFQLDLNQTNSSLVLADFLEQTAQLPKARDRILAIKSVLGDEDGRPFLKTINNLEQTSELVKNLRADVGSLAGAMGNKGAAVNERYAKTMSLMTVEVTKLAKSFATLANRFLEPLIRWFTALVGWINTAVEAVNRFFNNIDGSAARVLGDELATDMTGLNAQIEDMDTAIGKIDKRLQGLRDAQGRVFNNEMIQASIADQQLEELSIKLKALEGEKLLIEEKRVKANEAIAELKRQQATAATGPETPDLINPDLGISNDLKTEDVEEKKRHLFDLTESERAYAEQMWKRQAIGQQIVGAEKAQLAEEKRIATERKAVYGSLVSAFSNFASSMANKSKTWFKVFKGIQIAQALTSAYTAANQVLADISSFSLGQKLLAYGKVLAIGLNTVAKIKGITASGGGGGGGGSTGGGIGSSGDPSVGTGVGARDPDTGQEPNAQDSAGTVNINVPGLDILTALGAPEAAEAFREGLESLGLKVTVNTAEV